MASAFRLLLLICGIGQLFTGAESQSDRCPPGWTQLNNRCYFFRSQRLTFDEAENDCKVLGGHLVSVHSRLELAVVNELVQLQQASSLVWIGLYGNEANLAWTDGSDVDFTNGLISFSENGCVAINIDDDENGFAWIAIECERLQQYVCARDVFQCVSICMQEDASAVEQAADQVTPAGTEPTAASASTPGPPPSTAAAAATGGQSTNF
ncbi:snaclec bothroinsularin subunit beta-like isoform X2 [Festucalex cinctus]